MKRLARVLLVEDDPEVRWLTAEALRARYEVVLAASPAEALERARAAPLDAIVADLTLGRESGWELIRSLHADTELRTVPVIVLSACALPPSGGPGPWAAYLTEPCPMPKLREVLEWLLEPARATRHMDAPQGGPGIRRPRRSPLT